MNLSGGDKQRDTIQYPAVKNNTQNNRARRATILCLGQAAQDFVFALDAMPRQADKYRAEAFHSVGGGPAANAAVTVSRLGGRAKLAARLGQDDIAELIDNELREHAVDCGLLRRFPGCRSSLSSVIVDKQGERLIVNYLDPRLPDTADWLPPDLVIGMDAALVDTRWPAGAARALEQAKQAGLPAVLDADKPMPDDSLLQSATHVAFSAAGLRDFSGHDRFEQTLLEINRKLGLWCCVTLGASGVLYVDRQTPRLAPARPVTPVDTLGAGDVWHGAFVLALAEGRDEAAAIHFANAAAALKVQRFGGRSGIPRRDELEALLRDDPAEKPRDRAQASPSGHQEHAYPFQTGNEVGAEPCA